MIEKERLYDWLGVATFGYLILDSLFVLWFNGYTSRISLLGFLIPHASKILIWSMMALFVLRQRFGWRFPFALLLLYCIAELFSNWLYVPAHWLTEPAYRQLWIDTWTAKNYYFVFSNIFFILGITLGHIFLSGRYRFKVFDWSMLPLGTFLAIWIFQTGYVTDSTLLIVNPLIELYEFLWSVFYLILMYYIFLPVKPRSELPSLIIRS